MTCRLYRVVRRPRALLVAAVAPESLSSALSNLVRGGLIAGYEEGPAEVVIWGDLGTVECQLALLEPPAQPTQPADRRADYFRACRQFMHTRSFRSLPPVNRAIWRLHAVGLSHQQICFKLQVSPMKVRVAIRGARLAAQLPATVSSMPRGGGPGRPPTPDALRPRCGEGGCGKPAESRGYCNAHYQRRLRRGNLS